METLGQDFVGDFDFEEAFGDVDVDDVAGLDEGDGAAGGGFGQTNSLHWLLRVALSDVVILLARNLVRLQLPDHQNADLTTAEWEERLSAGRRRIQFRNAR